MTDTTMRPDMDQWWRSAVIYQVYPRSFADSGADGLGDLPGIISKLDYLAKLGVDAIWISPFYPSPQADAGYDVADYFDINPDYGTLADYDKLVSRAHALGIKVIRNSRTSTGRTRRYTNYLGTTSGSGARRVPTVSA